MDNHIVVTYVVAIYNVGKYLRECLESIIRLKRNDCEIILVNDGSSDNSLDICKEYAEKDKRIKIINQENSGVSIARNKGIEAARGDWIVFIDGDDMINAENIEADILPSLDLNNDIVYFCYDDYKKGQTIRKKWPEEKGSSYYADHSDVTPLKWIILNPYYSGFADYQGIFIISSPWAKLYNRKFLETYNIRFKKGIKRGQDSLFNLNASLYVRKVDMLPYYGYVYRKNDGSITHRFSPDMVKCAFQLIGEFDKVLEQVHDDNTDVFFSIWKEKQLYSLAKTYYCNPDNKDSYIKRRSEFMSVYTADVFKDSFKKLKISDFNGVNKLIAIAIKYKMFFVLNIFLRYVFKYLI